MKTLKKLAFIALTFVLVSCGSDDSSPSFDLTDENIAGEYSLNSFEYTNETTISVAGKTITATSEETTGSTYKVNAVFSSNGTFTLSGQLSIEGTDASGNTIDDIVDMDDVTGTYSLNDEEDEITLTFSDIEDLDIDLDGTYDVDSFSSEKLVISKEKEEEESVESENLTITTISSIKISFEK